MNEKHVILVVDDNPTNLRLLEIILRKEYEVISTTDSAKAIEICNREHIDLILLDIMMPEIDGYDVCKNLKEYEKTKNIPIIFVTAKNEIEDEKKGLNLGAVDYITKPISSAIILARVRNHIHLHLYQEHLEELVTQRTRQLRVGYIDTVYRLTLASEYKDEETGAHIKRISYYTKELSQQMGMDSDFCDSIFYASPMHDIGKIAILDSILLKNGPLGDDEWKTMKTHAEIGAKILEGSESPLLRMAVDIAKCHHERWDGSGYPRGLKSKEIPITSRIMNIADQYDALRSKRPYKPSFDQKKAVSIITKGDGRTMPHHFDPEILAAFKKSVNIFADIFEEQKDF
jgi:putative two-component system response regulator